MKNNDLSSNNVVKPDHTVLVVEDNPVFLTMFKKFMDTKYNLYCAENGRAALQMLEDIPKPNIIISDILMDDINGYELLDRLSKNSRYSDIPVIFITSQVSLDEKIIGLSKGAVDFIHKPFAMVEMLSKVDSILRNQLIKEKLYEKEKFSAIGMLLSGISHEILNPLGGIHAPLENLVKNISGIDSIPEASRVKIDGDIGRIFENVKRIEDIIKMIRSLYNDKYLDTEQINLFEIVQFIISLFETRVTGRITFTIQVSETEMVDANRSALTQIIVNLVANAIDAIDKNGAIIFSSFENNGIPALAVSDTGHGISENDRSSIFNAFFTTKQNGTGSGLGLYFVKELIIRQGWGIDVTSSADTGTIFTVTLGKIK